MPILRIRYLCRSYDVYFRWCLELLAAEADRGRTKHEKDATSGSGGPHLSDSRPRLRDCLSLRPERRRFLHYSALLDYSCVAIGLLFISSLNS